jgi:hypothetical protein
MPEKIELCENCTYADDYKENPDEFKEVLGRFASSGFSCDGPVQKLAEGSSPFAVPQPRMVKQCGLDSALEKALNEAGYQDTPEENTGRQMFLRGELEFRHIDEPQ